MILQGWVNGILINESSVYGTLCIVLLKILNMGLYFSEIDTRGWPYRRQDLLLPFNHSFAHRFIVTLLITIYLPPRFFNWGNNYFQSSRNNVMITESVR